jgi:ribosome-associated toxin RatA of RatAB toxin-antitoxin module
MCAHASNIGAGARGLSGERDRRAASAAQVSSGERVTRRMSARPPCPLRAELVADADSRDVLAVTAHTNAVIEVELDGDGKPRAATATATVAAPPARLWQLILDLERYPKIVPMMHKVRREGDRVTAQLRFKVSIISVGFEFTADATYEEPRRLELRWVDGEPRDIRIRFDIDDAGDGTSRVRARIAFDPLSLGWLAKYFLRHHPEIQFGILPGCALALVDSMRRAAEGR